MTHIRLAAANEDVLAGALRTAWKLRIEKNAKPGSRREEKESPRRHPAALTSAALSPIPIYDFRF